MADILHLLRVTIETEAPLSSASGEAGTYDMQIARDANGLPEIAGSSLQGVLRHLYDQTRGEEETNALFGFADEGRGASSRLFFSFGRVHDSHDIAVSGRTREAPDFDDELLRILASEAPLHRDHVALTDRHVPEGHAKFERVAVPVGTRFSFEIAMYGSRGVDVGEEKSQILSILPLFTHPNFRLGGAARRGYGKVGIRRAGYRPLSLKEPHKIRDLREQASISALAGFENVVERARTAEVHGTVVIKVRLSPIGLWRVGSTGDPLRTGADELRDIDHPRGGPNEREKDVDAAAVREPTILWGENKDGDVVGAWEDPWQPIDQRSLRTPSDLAFTIAGSAIKGPLAHRTLYHWNKLSKNLVDRAAPPSENELSAWRHRPPELEAFFGAASDSANGGKVGTAARVIVDDATAKVSLANGVGALVHNSIDRFTGGVRNRFLFSEEVIIGGTFEVTLTILPPLNPNAGHEAWPDGRVAEAFCCALDDLTSGRLAIGAKSLGFCAGSGPDFNGDKGLADRWNLKWQAARKARTEHGDAA